MKVSQLFKIYWPDNGGGIAKVIQMISGFIQSWADENDIREFSQQIIVCQSRPGVKTSIDLYENIQVKRCEQSGVFASTPISNEFLKTAGIEGKEANLVICHFPYPMNDLSLLLKKFRSKVVVWWHCDYEDNRHKFLAKLFTPLVNHSLKVADRIIVSAPGNIAGSKILKKYEDKCVIIPFSVDTKWAMAGERYFRKTPMKPHDRIEILFIGRFVWYKGLDILLRAYAKINQDNMHLTLVGDGPLFEQIQGLAQELNLDNVTFTGSVSEQGKMEYVEQCDFLVLPSISKAEAFAIVQIEAMAFGKPVINTKLPSGVPDIAPNGVAGITVSPNSIDELSKAMKMLIEDNGLRKEYGRNAIELVRKYYTTEKVEKQYKDFFSEILKPVNVEFGI